MRERLRKTLFRRLWRITRGMTMGVRGVVCDGGRGVFLVRHSYIPGWYLPGGGVERGETVYDALARELQEEGNILIEGPPRLHGIFLNEQEFRGDHVAVFVVDDWRQEAPPTPGLEIVEAGFFPVDALPKGTTPGTRRRLAELFQGAECSPHW